MTTAVSRAAVESEQLSQGRAARIANVAQATLRAALLRRDLPAVRFNDRGQFRWLISRPDLDRWMAERLAARGGEPERRGRPRGGSRAAVTNGGANAE